MTVTRPETAASAAGVQPRATPADGGWLLLLSLCAYLLLTNGYLQTNDVLHTLSAARGLVADGDPAVTTAVVPGGGAAVGGDGRAYAPHGIGMTLLFVPVVVLGVLLDGDGGAPWLVPFLASFLNAGCGAVGVWAFHAVLRVLGVRRRPAIAATLLCAFASLHLVYSTLSFDVLPAGTALLLGTLGLLRWSRTGSALALAASGTAFAGSVLIRLDSVLVVAVAGLGLLAWGWRAGGAARACRAAVLWAVPLLGAVAVTGWYNLVRFGSVLDDGHGPDPQVRLETPLVTGVLGLLASPGKSVVLYTPVLVLALLGLRALARRDAVLTATVTGAGLVSLVFHALLVNWSGDLAWGPRFLVPVLGLLLLPLGPLLERWRGWGGARRAAVVVVALLSAGVQWLGIAVNVDAVQAANPAYARASAHHFAVGNAPLPFHARAVAASLRGEGPYLTASPAEHAQPLRAARVDVWWLVRPVPGPGARAGVVAVLLLGLGAAAARLVTVLVPVPRTPARGVAARLPSRIRR